MQRNLFLIVLGLLALLSLSTVSAAGCSGMSRNERQERLERIRGGGHHAPAQNDNNNPESGGNGGFVAVGLSLGGFGALGAVLIPLAFMGVSRLTRIARFLMPGEWADNVAAAVWYWGWLEGATGLYALVCFLAILGIGGMGAAFGSGATIGVSLVPGAGFIAGLLVMLSPILLRRRARTGSPPATGADGDGAAL